MSCEEGDVYDVIADQGATFIRSITLKTAAKKPINITGVSGRMHVRTKTNEPDTIFMLTTENGGLSVEGPKGTINIYISAEDTAATAAADYVYDLEIYSNSEVNRILQGSFTLRAEVTK